MAVSLSMLRGIIYRLWCEIGLCQIYSARFYNEVWQLLFRDWKHSLIDRKKFIAILIAMFVTKRRNIWHLTVISGN